MTISGQYDAADKALFEHAVACPKCHGGGILGCEQSVRLLNEYVEAKAALGSYLILNEVIHARGSLRPFALCGESSVKQTSNKTEVTCEDCMQVMLDGE